MEEGAQKNIIELKTELVSRMEFLRSRIMTLEWDKKQNQLNAGLESVYENLKKEYEELKQQLQLTHKD